MLSTVQLAGREGDFFEGHQNGIVISQHSSGSFNSRQSPGTLKLFFYSALNTRPLLPLINVGLEEHYVRK